ncbi:hypothetical protein N5J48_04330 [Acinetobacter ursingii]|uniref:hypothetical protein n=1 Tax=Acinetobacter ursingii TaxID=108980 RepID=UPI000CAD8F1F|nr:hypothetical protein [Acinetobacter ursingii]MDG9859399.1 hypothetical protein [Acinetobacter ursingii]MDG9894915.1 hypothetical protein [Acinetobacter ursingii]MDH0006607.1 hypothetical protein [Acinetobacter ursingii]MDH0478406.1 hypothetical protein [Acinetobacter ursingii]MDH2118977.1 hypothetical protein [Acinetobacter ursingii]
MKNLTQINDLAKEKKPKLIQTELGTEKLCIECDEYWPLDSEFWFTYKNKPKKDGSISIGYEAACKCCYSIRYRPHVVKGKNIIRSNHERVAA